MIVNIKYLYIYEELNIVNISKDTQMYRINILKVSEVSPIS